MLGVIVDSNTGLVQTCIRRRATSYEHCEEQYGTETGSQRRKLIASLTRVYYR